MLYTCIHMAIASFMTPFKAYKISSLHRLTLAFLSGAPMLVTH